MLRHILTKLISQWSSWIWKREFCLLINMKSYSLNTSKWSGVSWGLQPYVSNTEIWSCLNYQCVILTRTQDSWHTLKLLVFFCMSYSLGNIYKVLPSFCPSVWQPSVRSWLGFWPLTLIFRPNAAASNRLQVCLPQGHFTCLKRCSQPGKGGAALFWLIFEIRSCSIALADVELVV